MFGKRIILLGNGGSGKSTLAKELGPYLGIEVVHLDVHFWSSGWIQPNKDDWDKELRKIMQKESYIMDGNYFRTIAERLTLADTVVFLDVPRFVSIFRIIKRRIMYRNVSRPDMAEGCNEQLDLEFVKWVWNFKKHRRNEILKMISDSNVENKLILSLKDINELKKKIRE